MKQLQVGDKVRYSAKFLRSICDYSYRSGNEVYTVKEINVIDGLAYLTFVERDTCGLASNFHLYKRGDKIHFDITA